MLSHMVVKPGAEACPADLRLRVVLSHMVVKHQGGPPAGQALFESSVISYGSQTSHFLNDPHDLFESSVISYGSQTKGGVSWQKVGFESSVISYGSQTGAVHLIGTP